ncbi:MAG: ATP-binding cassette domain-containing protein [Actinomycetota bacterium]|nr:ATP-binding cassette domain-containing protein [Actinomycetota bacterium]
MTTPLLDVRGLTVRYGGVVALDGVDLEVGAGSLVGLIGPNGAGKTTFIDAVTGFARAAGTVAFEGRSLDTLSPHARARAGLARTFQGGALFEDLSVEDQLRVAAERPGVRDLLTDACKPWRRVRRNERVEQPLELLGLDHCRSTPARELPHGTRRLVGIARALAAAPRLVLLDEPAAGLDPADRARLGDHLRAIVAHGASVLLVDHDVDLVFSVCDVVYVLDFGAVIVHGPPGAVRIHPALVEAYLGTAVGEEP